MSEIYLKYSKSKPVVGKSNVYMENSATVSRKFEELNGKEGE